MAVEKYFHPERNLANIAEKPFFATQPEMTLESLSLPEILTTDVAHLLLFVGLRVPGNVLRPIEHQFPAGVAPRFIDRLVRWIVLHLVMYGQTRLRRVGFAADVAKKRPQSRMFVEMFYEIRLSIKPLIADLADILQFTLVRVLVQLHVSFGRRRVIA